MYTANFTKNEWLVVKPNRARPSRISVTAYEGQVDIYDAPLTAETEANAYLIAAAPDLYAACKQMVTWYENESQQVVSEMDAVRAALAKARGENV